MIRILSNKSTEYYIVYSKSFQINPQHTVPTLVDSGFSLWESRAVCMYLVDKYGKDDSLYPKDPKARAIVNQRLYFDMGTLYQRFSDYYYPMIFRKQEADKEKFAPMETAMEFLDTFLSYGEYAAGNTMTIADFALMTTISTYDVANFDRTKYTNITRWYDLCKKTMPGWEMNLEGAEEFRKFF